MATLPEYILIRSRRKTIALQIKRDGALIVKAPYLVPHKHIKDFLLQHIDWIDKKLESITQAKMRRETEEYLFLGQKLRLSIGNYPEISVVGDRLEFPQGLLFRKEKELTNWYILQARTIISLQVKRYAQEMNTTYKEITFSDTKSQWGRCTRDNRLQFSWRLVMSPLIVLNYVVIHELAHTFQKNHSQLFWSKVRTYNPSYRQQIKWLKEYGPSLTF